MSPQPDARTAPGQPKDEMIFLVLVKALAPVAGVGSWFAAAFSRHDQLHANLPDKERA